MCPPLSASERCVVFFFNDTATTEIYTLSLHDALPITEVIGEAMQYITDGMNLTVVFAEGAPLTVQLPPVAVLTVTEAEDAARGDTVSSIQKVAKLETGIEVKVPAHIKVGEKIKVNTETGEFQGRA